jgi:hypothetical protein
MLKKGLNGSLDNAKIDLVAVKQVARKKAKEEAKDAASWFERTLGFKPFNYQKELIEKFNLSQFVAARWCRQSGKSWIVSALLLNYAVKHDDSYIAVVGPSWRQTKLNIRRISYFLRKLEPGQYLKPGRTILRFTNGSVIEAFPNNSETIRGPTLNCVPGYVKVTLSDGSQIPISKIKPGDEVLSFDPSTKQLESKKVLSFFINPLAGRRIVRVFHDLGHFDCTEDHKIYTVNRGYVASKDLNSKDKSLGHPQTMPDMRKDFRTNTGEGKRLFPRAQKIVQASAKEAPKITEEVLYDIEVEDNHNFFANGILVSNCVWWDEANFTPNDADLYDAILFTLGTTDGKLIATSTPWNTDSIFWKMCNHKDWADFDRSHIGVEQAKAPKGPLRPNMIDKIHKQFGEDPARWRREMEAEWAEDEDVWLPQSLIVACVGTEKNCGEDLQPWNAEKGYEGDLFAGLDLAQVRDFCVFSVIERRNDRLFLRHLKIFSQPTKYAHVLGYVKTLQDRWGGFAKIRVDFTKEGPSIISDMETAGIKNAEGVNFNVARKSEMVNLLKQRMADERFFYPLLTWEKPYRSDVCTELNVEKYELRKDGTIMLSHPTGTHDDVFWSIALAVYATVEMKPVDLEALRFG